MVARTKSVLCSLLLPVLLWPIAAMADEPNGKPDISPERMIKMFAKVSDSDGSSLEDFDKVTKDAKKYEGLFTLYEKGDHLYALIKPDQFDKMLIAPMAIARGMASAGTPLNFGDEWILTFKKINDKEVQLIRKNIRYEAPKDSPLARAVEQNYTDSVLMTLPIISKSQGNAFLIDLADIFLTNFAQLPFGSFDRSRARWDKIKVFPNNVELQVEATFSGSPYGAYFGDDGIIDTRGITLVIHYSLVKRSESGYKPRLADNRVGHFLNATKDFASSDPMTTFVRRINRWNLEKANPSADMSPPKKQLVWWVEDTVPHEYRPYVEAGILEWNKAFEKIGFRNAIGVRWQNERDEFDPEDINYCTFRWITTPNTFAMSGLRSDPITGEMLDGDVIFDASWIRAWTEQYAMMVGKPVAAAAKGSASVPELLAVGEIISPIMAIKHGYGLPGSTTRMLRAMGGLPQADAPQIVPAGMSPMQMQLSERLHAGRYAACQCASAKRSEYALAAIALARTDSDKGDKDSKSSKKIELPDDFIGQAIKEVVMHEVGHSLGLRHNFHSSTMLSLEEINDPNITRKKGMVGSVMDYAPLNIVAEGKAQGDFATQTIGPYDYWAIEYAYKPISGDEAKELEKIASRSPEPDLVFATDEDMYLANDPMVNAYDLGNDPLRYAKDRVRLAEELIKDLDERVVEDGQSWARLRPAFSVLIGQFGNASYLASSFIAGEQIARDHKGGENARDPITPVDAAKQREALEFLTTKIFSDEAFQFSPKVLRRLAVENWYHWGSYTSPLGSNGFNLYDRVLGIQRIALRHCLSADVLGRLQNQRAMAADGENVLGMDEVFRALTDSVWKELSEGSQDACCSTIRRNLQREHLSRLAQIAVRPGTDLSQMFFVSFANMDGSYPADARSLARMHLKDIKGMIETAVKGENNKLDDSTRAHLEECHDQITKVLEATIATNQP